jgi:hypothetical protein
MTKIEAVDLPDQLGKDCELFNNLQEIIPLWNICLNEHYGEKREDWKPYGKDAETIKNIFDDGISKINEDRIKKTLFWNGNGKLVTVIHLPFYRVSQYSLNK